VKNTIASGKQNYDFNQKLQHGSCLKSSAKLRRWREGPGPFTPGAASLCPTTRPHGICAPIQPLSRTRRADRHHCCGHPQRSLAAFRCDPERRLTYPTGCSGSGARSQRRGPTYISVWSRRRFLRMGPERIRPQFANRGNVDGLARAGTR